MHTSATRIAVALLVAGAGVYSGIRLARYSDADDAPGGIVIAMLLVVGSVALAVWIARGRPRKPSTH